MSDRDQAGDAARSGNIGSDALGTDTAVDGKSVPQAQAADHLTSGLLDIMARLRDPETGCPWDVEQDFSTIAPYTIEEAYEVADAIDRNDMADLMDELGDLMFQVVFHSQMASEAGHFDYADVIRNVSEKMVRRHPHVFGANEFSDVAIDSAEAQTANWEHIKAEERVRKAAARADQAEGPAPVSDAPESALDGVPVNLPALMRAQKIGKRAARVGFDWADPLRVLDKIEEEIIELRAEISAQDSEKQAEELGDLLFAMTNLARHLGLDAEEALRSGNKKFERRFRALEQSLVAPVQDHDLETLEAAWQAVKATESQED